MEPENSGSYGWSVLRSPVGGFVDYDSIKLLSRVVNSYKRGTKKFVVYHNAKHLTVN
jgi:hypothetical protein